MLNQDFIDVLKIIYKKLEDIPLLIAGSTALALQNVDVQPNDLDIVIKEEDFPKAVKLLKEYQVKEPEYRSNEFFEGNIAFFKIKGIEIELMGDLKLKKSNKYFSFGKNDFHLIKINLQNMELYVYSLVSQIDICNSMGREKDLKKIKKIKEILI
jgi:hypothetical protein